MPAEYLNSRASIDAFIDRFDVFLFDCDGENEQTMNFLERRRFLTNRLPQAFCGPANMYFLALQRLLIS
jgi:hypothetical protein